MLKRMLTSSKLPKLRQVCDSAPNQLFAGAEGRCWRCTSRTRAAGEGKCYRDRAAGQWRCSAQRTHFFLGGSRPGALGKFRVRAPRDPVLLVVRDDRRLPFRCLDREAERRCVDCETLRAKAE